MNYEERYKELEDKVLSLLTWDMERDNPFDGPVYEEMANELLYDICEERGYEINDEETSIRTCSGCGEYVTKIKNFKETRFDSWQDRLECPNSDCDHEDWQ
tara:strand:+ start:1318 stop:1620 length:303 start_codon:yes stop_codon:yes gene_type:complete